MKYKFWKLPVFKDARGALAALDKQNLPFTPKRIYFLFDVKGMRGGHAHSLEKEVFICVKGKFRARVHDGKRFRSFRMSTPGQALYTPNMIWHEFDQFTPDAVMLAFSSVPFNGRKGYIIDFEEFLSLCRKKS